MSRLRITGYVDTSAWPAQERDRESPLLGLSLRGMARLRSTPLGALDEYGVERAEPLQALADRGTDQLVALLDARDAADSDDARDALVERGRGVLPAVRAALPRLGRYGALSAIEVLSALPDAASGPVLVEVLASEHDTVARWAAEALAPLGHAPAVPALRARHALLRARGEDPDGGEATTVREALTTLGGRDPLTPALTASLALEREGSPVWPATALGRVADDLAAHGLLLLASSVQAWEPERRGARTGLRWHLGARWTGPRAAWPADTAGAWDEAVRAATTTAHHLAALVPPDSTDLVSLDWLVREDLDPPPPA